MNGLIDKAAPQPEQSGGGLDEQIDLATQVTREALYADGSAERLFTVVEEAESIGVGLGKALVMAMMPIVTGMHEQEPNLDPNIWLMDGGVVDSILEELVDIVAEGGIQVGPEEMEQARMTIEQDVTKIVEQGGQNEPVR